MHLSHAIVFVSDMARSVTFYRDVLGLPVKFESTHWTELDTGEATIALHIRDGAIAGGDQPRPELPGHCRPGLSVADLDAFHQRMVEHGVPCVQEPKDVFGARIAQYVDPDGLTLSVGEHRADRSD
ncbi:MAG: VOC family protein [Planctomycetota bacterium]|jgi:lactoylglutathione lyase